MGVGGGRTRGPLALLFTSEFPNSLLAGIGIPHHDHLGFSMAVLTHHSLQESSGFPGLLFSTALKEQRMAMEAHSTAALPSLPAPCDAVAEGGLSLCPPQGLSCSCLHAQYGRRLREAAFGRRGGDILYKATRDHTGLCLSGKTGSINPWAAGARSSWSNFPTVRGHTPKG